MFVQFSVKNHKSIKEKATISMSATKDKSLQECLISPDKKRNLVPVMAVYGANAAGKSNVLHALFRMRDMVCGKYAKLLKGETLPQEPFAFVEEEFPPTEFEIIYYYKGIKYAYGYTFDKKQILTEYLYHWPRGREALVFSRNGENYEFRDNIPEQMTLAGRTPGNRLYLVTSNEWNCAQTEKAYLWFQQGIYGEVSGEMDLEQTLQTMQRGEVQKREILKEILLADLGITDVVITGTKKEPEISTVHCLTDKEGKKRHYTLELQQESMGTQRFFARIGFWLEALEKGAVILADEIEASMHPLLTRHLIEMIQNPQINIHHAQLIFTTHDMGLLDLTLLRRDQIWFAEKDENTMQTEIYALTDFSPRKGENISKGYLQGRYGAIPFIGGGEDLWDE